MKPLALSSFPVDSGRRGALAKVQFTPSQIRSARARLGLSIAGMAALSGVSEARLQAFEACPENAALPAFADEANRVSAAFKRLGVKALAAKRRGSGDQFADSVREVMVREFVAALPSSYRLDGKTPVPATAVDWSAL
jgi:hypothetical protein